MDKSKLPKAPARPGNVGSFKWDCRPLALQRWNANVRAADGEGDNTISILDEIGTDFFGNGVTVKRVMGALRAIGERDVVVNINSPGGDYFEGLAIYNALREHKGRVTVNVLGIAASAASLVAMAGDQIRMARAGFMMIHNTWVMAIGDRHLMNETADWLEPFDAAARDIFATRTGLDEKEVGKMLDRETWIGGKEAVDKGFADEFLASDAVKEDVENATAAAVVRADKFIELCIKAHSGLSRTKTREIMQQFKSGTPCAAEDVKPGADEEAITNQIRQLIRDVKR